MSIVDAIPCEPAGKVAGAEHAGSAGATEAWSWAPLAALGAAEALLAIAHLVFGLGIIPVAVLHIVIVALAGSRLLTAAPPGGDLTSRGLILLAVAAAGPIGLLVGWRFVTSASRPSASSPLLDDWYRRIALSAEIDPVTELCDNVASGRTMNLASPVPQSLLAVMASGSIAEQQTALGLIARRFHPDYLPALSRALRSPEPIIRVQAAAVVARIRDQLQDDVRARLAGFDAGARPGDADAALSVLAKAAGSGLIDETDRRRVDALLEREAAKDIAAFEGGANSGYKGFRITRRRRRIARRGCYRVRSLRRLRRQKGGSS